MNKCLDETQSLRKLYISAHILISKLQQIGINVSLSPKDYNKIICLDITYFAGLVNISQKLKL